LNSAPKAVKEVARVVLKSRPGWKGRRGFSWGNAPQRNIGRARTRIKGGFAKRLGSET